MKRLRPIILTLAASAISLTVIADRPRSSKSFADKMRESKEAMKNDTSSFASYSKNVSDTYEQQRREMIARYIAYRDSVMKEFIDALGKDWKEGKTEKPLPKPVDNSVPPVILETEPEQDETPAPEPEKEAAPAPEPEKEVAPTPEPEKEAVPAPEPQKEPKKEPKKEPQKEPKKEPQKDLSDNTKPAKDTKPAKENRKPREKVAPAGIGPIKIDQVLVIPSIKGYEPPKPFVPVVIPEETVVVKKCEFDFFGNKLAIPIDDDCRFTLTGNTNYGVSKAVSQISKNDKYSIVLHECLELRDKLNLCDWAYYMMLKKFGEAFFGKECNEATLLTGYLYCMSGYQMRFAFVQDTRKLELLIACDQRVVGTVGWSFDSKIYFYIFNREYNVETKLDWCDYALPKEKCMSLWVGETPKLPFAQSNGKRTPYNKKTPIVSYSVNKNLVDFYNTYPIPRDEGDLLSTWKYYTQAPMSASAVETLYPQLREMIAGKSQYDAVNALMQFVLGFKYGLDSELWGYDRPFFPEEMLYYPFSDCEDHAILFTRLVRDLLNLPTAFLKYPEHLAAAVCFDNGKTFGDYIDAGGMLYTVCDPTYYGAKVGDTAPDMRKYRPTLIIIK